MKAFHGDPAVKEKYLARLKAHHEADEIIQGTGFEDGHGCAVGCTLNKYDHSAYENELGLPQWLAHLEDRVFEGLPPKKAQQFAVDFLGAVPVGADVDKVRWQLAFQRHTQARDRLLLNKEAYAVRCVAAIEQVIAYCELEIKGSAESAARSAESAAWSAARSAARSAESAARSAAWSAESAAWSAAWSAESAAWSVAESVAWSAESAESAESAAWSAESAAWSAESAARSVAESVAWSAAWSAESAVHYEWEVKTLLELLRAAPQAA